MLITTVPPNQWESFADQFSRQHRGWLVTLEAIDSRLLETDPDQAETQSRALAGDGTLREVALEQDGETRRLRIVVGEGPDQVVHRTGPMLAVQFEATEAGDHQGLLIDDAGGITTRVRFRAPAAPEMLDGIGEAEW